MLLLVFRIHPRISIYPHHVHRIKFMYDTKKYITIISYQTHLRTASSLNVPLAADGSYIFGDKVLMYRDDPIVKWVGSYSVSNRDHKILTHDTGYLLIRASVYYNLNLLHDYSHEFNDNVDDITHPLQLIPMEKLAYHELEYLILSQLDGEAVEIDTTPPNVDTD